MPAKHRLDAVATLARHRQRLAEKALAQAEISMQTRRQTLEQLRRFRDDYDRHDHPRRSSVVSSHLMRDYHHFIQRLDDAITEQMRELEQSDGVLAELRRVLQAATTRAESLDLVIARSHDLAQQRDRAAEQRLLDELATLGSARQR